MSEVTTAKNAGYLAAQDAIRQRGGTWKLRPRQDDYARYVTEWQEYLEGWMQAICEDREKQLSWDFFYDNGILREDYRP